MSKISKIEVFPGINDAPVESTATEGCNGAAIVQRVNSLATATNLPVSSVDDCAAEITYYVDTVNGSESNDGLTTGTPFKYVKQAIDKLSGYAIDDCEWTTIYIKGVVEEELDFSYVYGWFPCVQQWSAFPITLDKWPGEADNWIYRTPEAVAGIYAYSVTIRSKSQNGLKVNFNNCTFEISGYLSFLRITPHFLDCIFYTVTSAKSSTSVFFKECHGMIWEGVTIDNATVASKNLYFYFDNCIVWQYVGITWVKGGNMTFEVSNNSMWRVEDWFCDTGTNEVWFHLDESSQIVVPYGNYTALQGININAVTGHIMWGKSHETITNQVFYSTMVDGEYPICTFTRPGYIKTRIMSGAAGNGTFQLSHGSTLIGSPSSSTFSNRTNMIRVTNINYRVTNPSDTIPLKLVVTSSTGLTDIFIQVNIQPY